MWALGVGPDYQGRAVDSAPLPADVRVLAARRDRLEVNYVLEDNAPMLNAMGNLGLEPLRRYRVYEMAL